MASSRVSLIALGVGAYLAFAVATFPASIAVRWLAPDALALAGLEGTVWQGNAAYGSVAGLAFSDLEWQLDPLPLLLGRLRLTAEARLSDGLVLAGMTVTRNHVSVHDLRASLNLAALSGLVQVDRLLGNASVELEGLELVDGWPVSATGTVRVVNLESSPWLPTPGVETVKLGSYEARLAPAEEPGIVALVNDQGGPLELEGTARLTADRRWRVDARIKPRADAEQTLAEGLKFVAPADAGGYHAIELEGPI